VPFNDLANDVRSTFVPKQPKVIPESVSVDPIDTMVAGMENPFSIHNDYETVEDSRARSDQQMTQWPASLNLADSPLNLHQASISLSSPGSRNRHLEHRRPNNDLKFCIQPARGSMQQRPSNGSMSVAEKAAAMARLKPRRIIEQRKKQQPGLSTAPQTKAEQQRQALKKLSRAVSDEMEESSSPVDLEEAVLRILAGANEPEEGTVSAQGLGRRRGQAERTNKVFLSKSEAIKAAQAISNLIKQSPGSAYSQPRKTAPGFPTNPKVCDLCGYAVARACDLKKHMKRHEKPYGCTYPKCHKRFGAKSDWKRHENSQHFQLEAYRCRLASPAGKVCGEHFLRMEHFKQHLETKHNMTDELGRNEEAKLRKIGKNCQQQFWCGFHGDIVVLKERRNAAWDERFDHIAHHFEKDKKSIEEWICAEENKTKKELLKEMDRYVFDDEDERGPATVECVANKGPPPIVHVDVPASAPMDQLLTPTSMTCSSQGKRKSSADLSGHPVHKQQRTRSIEPSVDPSLEPTHETVETTYCVSAVNLDL
jgi:hypothetical protein